MLISACLIAGIVAIETNIFIINHETAYDIIHSPNGTGRPTVILLKRAYIAKNISSHKTNASGETWRSKFVVSNTSTEWFGDPVPTASFDSLTATNVSL